MRDFIRKYNVAVTIAVCFLLLMVYLIVPWKKIYNHVYADPTFLCKDNSYSYAATSDGACSGHGGIVVRYAPTPAPR